MFLKTESFEHNGVTVTLSELSALQRIEHLAWLKEQEKKAESSGNLQVSVEDLIRGGAFLVAMSLWHNHPQKTKLPSPTWPRSLQAGRIRGSSCCNRVVR